MPYLPQQIGRLERRWTVVDGLRVHARVSAGPVAAGRPVVILVHGLSVSSRYMVPTAVRLAPYGRVYAPDLPGFGKSAKPPHVLNVPELAGSLAAWMDAVGLQRAAFVANSVGCQIVADLALRDPSRVERVVLTGPTMDTAGRTAREQVRRLLLDIPRETLPALLLEARDYLDTGLRWTLGTFRYALRDRIEEKLPHLRMPALVVRGSRDPIAPQRWAEEVACLLPAGRLVVIPGAAHAVNCNAPERLVRAIWPFLSAQPAHQEGAAVRAAVPALPEGPGTG